MRTDPLANTARVSAALSIVALVVGGAAGELVAGRAGTYGALLGIGFPTLFLGVTLAVALGTRRRAGGALGAIVLGTWLLKLIGLVAVLAVLKPLEFYDRPVFAVAFLGWTAVLLGVEVRVIKYTRQPYVEPT